MNKNIFLAVSSDSRDLYKADIYRILAKPNHSIEHFRYQYKWIDTTTDNSCIEEKSLIGNEVILYFKDTTLNTYIPVRKGIIKHFFYDSETEIYHYYFELLDFCELDVNQTINFKNDKFFYKFVDIKHKTTIWKKVIEKLKIYFPDKVFYKIDKLEDSDGKPLMLEYNSINHSYSYSLTQGNEYSLILSLANPNKSESTLTIKSSTSDVSIILSEDYAITIPYDKIKIPITTKNIDSFKEKSFLSFYLNDKEKKSFNEYENHIHITKTVNYCRPITFGFLSTALIVFTWLIKEKTKEIENVGCCTCSADWPTILYIGLIFITSSYLLAIYNKK